MEEFDGPIFKPLVLYANGFGFVRYAIFSIPAGALEVKVGLCETTSQVMSL